MTAQVDALIAQLRQQRASSSNEPVVCVYDTLIAALQALDASTGTVTSVGLALDAGLYTVSGSPVIAAGTLIGTLDTQTANTVFAGPGTGAAAKPTFRALVAADLPAATGTVTSVGIDFPSVITQAQFDVSNSPITTSGNIHFSQKNQSANTVLAGPDSGGATTPNFRALVAADIPSLSGLYLPLTGGSMTGGILITQNGGNEFVARFNSSSPRGGIYVAGTAAVPFFGLNLNYSAGNVFNYDVTGTAAMIGDIGDGLLSFMFASGTAGNPTGFVDTATGRFLSVNASTLLATFAGGVSPSQTAGIVGTTTNNDANAGSVGEFVAAEVDSGAAVAIVSGVTANVASFSLTAGDWDLFGVYNVRTTGVGSNILGALSIVSATITAFPNQGLSNLWQGISFTADGNVTMAGRLLLAATTTVYLCGQATFTVGATAFGFIGARRRR